MIKKNAIITVVILSLLALVHWIWKGFAITLNDISDSLFLVGMLTFLVGLINITSANRLTWGITFALSRFFQKEKKYETFSDYYYEKKEGTLGKNYYVFILGLIMIIIAFILAQAYLKQI